MPPRLLPKTPAESLHPESEEVVFEAVEDETDNRDEARSQNSRNFEFVNATGPTLPNATSRPNIRSHVMREANRLTYSATTGQSVGSSSASGPQVQEPLRPQVQKFRISSAGLRPMPPSKRSRRAQSRYERSSPSRLIQDAEEDEQQPEAQQILNNEPNDARSAMGELISDSGFHGFRPYIGDVLPSTAAQTLEHAMIPAVSSVGSRALIPRDVQLSTIGGEQMDPFNSLPIPQSYRTEILLHHYQAHLIESVPLMMAVRRLWFGKAMRDTAFLFIKLCHAAGSLSLIERSGDSIESLMFKNEAIKVINERLDQSSTHISEGTLGTVASIVSYESVNGTPESIQIHADGLQQMIKVRGGMSKGCHGLTRLVAWADLQSANALSTRPRLPAVDVLLGEMSLEDERHDSPEIHALSTFSPSWNQEDQEFVPYALVLNERVLDLIAKLRRLSNYLGSDQVDFGPVSDQLWLSDAIYNVQRGFMLASYDFEETPGIDQFCCIAGLVYVEFFLRRVNPNSKILHTLNGRLQLSISKVAEASQFEPGDGRSHLLVWALLIGAVSSNKVDWHVAQLRSHTGLVDARSWEEVESIVRDVAFPETFLPAAKHVWKRLVGN